jgi:hypothetical protein
MAYSADQDIAEDYTEVAAVVAALLNAASLTTLHGIIVKDFGENKWLVVIIYE